MTLFSIRHGIEPEKSIQIRNLDKDARNGLWNVFSILILRKSGSVYTSGTSELNEFTNSLWLNYFKNTVDTIPGMWYDVCEELKTTFFNSPWNKVFDFIEFTIKSYPFIGQKEQFKDMCNAILKREKCAYRIVGDEITPITDENEIKEIKNVIKYSKKPYAVHIETALSLYSDRKKPDYRNSIKESISAVESICKKIAKNDKTTLGSAIKEVEKKIKLHPNLKEAFTNLYGYTSDDSGIRHALLEKENLDEEDARFMLVSCSAFINYLITKVSKLGLDI